MVRPPRTAVLLFLDADGIAVADPLTLGPVTATQRVGTTSLLSREANETVPDGTRTLRFQGSGTLAGGEGWVALRSRSDRQVTGEVSHEDQRVVRGLEHTDAEEADLSVSALHSADLDP